MGKITYLNKDKLSLDDAIRKFRDIDANEIKAVVNGLDDLIIALTAQVTVNNGKVSYTDAAAVAQLVSDMATVQGLLVSDDTSLDSIQEIVDALKAAQATLASIDEGGEIVALIEAALGFSLIDTSTIIRQTLNFLNAAEVYEYVQPFAYRINDWTEEEGVTVTVKLGGTSTDYVKGDLLNAGDRLDFSVDTEGYVAIEGIVIIP